VPIDASGHACSIVDGMTVPWVDITDLVGGTSVDTITATATDDAGNTSEFSLPEIRATVTNMAPLLLSDTAASLVDLNPAPWQFDVEGGFGVRAHLVTSGIYRMTTYAQRTL
jgi:hypothetical protein